MHAIKSFKVYNILRICIIQLDYLENKQEKEHEVKYKDLGKKHNI